MRKEIQEMFDAIAPRYDALNHILSLHFDKIWRRRVVRIVRVARMPTPLEVLDVATGTGDLAILAARKIAGACVVGVDISEAMLARGREKIAARGLADRIELRSGDAENLPFADAAFDAVTVAFGVRNFGDMPLGISEMRRVLRPGGRCYILEFSQPRLPIFGPLYAWYFHRVLPRIGRLVSRDKEAYSYLPRSVGEFPRPGEFVEILRRAGFSTVKTRRLTMGVAYIYECEK